MAQQPLAVIGCGALGAAAVEHLKSRSLPHTALAVFAPDENTIVYRKHGAERFEKEAASGWPALEGQIPPGAVPLFGVIAQADDRVSGGALPSLLNWLKNRYRQSTILLAVGLPEAAAGPLDKARILATLQELESIRQATFRRCAFRTVSDPRRDGPLFGDAVVLQARLTQAPGGTRQQNGYVGFGLGIVREDSRLLERLGAELAIQMAEQLPERPAIGQADLERRVLKELAPLLLPAHQTELFARKRWSGFVPSGGSDAVIVERVLNFWKGSQARYDVIRREIEDEYEGRYRDAKDRLNELLQRRVDPQVLERVRAQLTSALHASHTDALRNRQRVDELHGQIAPLVDHSSLQIPTVPTVRPLVDEYDSCYLAWLMETEREKSLRAICDSWNRFQNSSGLSAKGRGDTRSFAERFRDFARKGVTAVQAEAPPHIAVPAVDMRLLQSARVNHQAIRAELEKAQDDFENHAMRALRAAADQARLAVAASAPAPVWGSDPEPWRPNLSVAPRPNSGRMPATVVWCSERLSEEIKRRIRADDSAPIKTESLPVSWEPREAVAYAETEAFDLDQLTIWPELIKQCASQPADGLYTLPEPPGGWPYRPPKPTAPGGSIASVRRKAAPPAPQSLQDVELTLVRAQLQGLLRQDDATGGYRLQALTGDGQKVTLLQAASETELREALAQNQPLQQQLDQLCLAWRNGLSPLCLAAYLALLLGSLAGQEQSSSTGRTAVLRSEFNAALERLNQHGPQWVEAAKAMATAIGSDRDDFSLPAGSWRYLKW